MQLGKKREESNPKIYLDYASSTPLDKKVLNAMLPYFSDIFGNPSSQHTKGIESAKILEKSREIIARAISAKPKEIIFTSSATESNNLVLKGLASFYKKGRFLISSIEHDSVLNPALYLKKQGFQIDLIPVDKFGIVSLEAIKKMLKKDTILVSVMHANNEIGTIQPIEKIARICQNRKILFHTDAAQTLDKIKINVKKINLDFLTGSSHKIYGPKGAGFLYIRKGTNIYPLLHGGHQEFNLRSSTENIPAIFGFAQALKIAQKEMRKKEKQIKKLRDKLISGILKSIPNCYLTGHPKKRLNNFASFRFDFIEGESIIMLLNQAGVFASTASACASGTLKPSHVLLACGLKPHQAHGSLRLTLGKETKEKDIDYVLKILPKIIQKLRKISPYDNK